MKDIENIIKLFENAAISKMELEMDNIKIKLEKNDVPVKVVQETKSSETTPEPDENQHFVCSPVVGTFYLKKSPDSEPYISVGKTVHKGDVLCIVEAMKVMNEIVADRDGEIIEIYRNNEDFVAYNDKIIAIRSI